jgi:hypothetical protein
MTPPRATASTTACDVQLAEVPTPTIRSGTDVSTGSASAGSGGPFGFPGERGSSTNRSAAELADAADPTAVNSRIVEAGVVAAPAPGSPP